MLPGANEQALTRTLCERSFYHFVQEFWHEVVPEKPVWNWHIKYLCDLFQECAERVIAGEDKVKDDIVNVSPGTTKSTVLSTMSCPWVWTRMPSARFICGSYTSALALDLGRKARDIVRSRKYQTLWPDVKLKEDQDTKGHYSNTANGMRYSVGVGSTIIGQHAHFQIVDDPLDPIGAASDDEKKSANDWMSETLPNRKVDSNLTYMMLVMQRLAQDDPTGYLLEQRKGEIRHTCLPGELTENVKPRLLRRHYVDGLFDPVRLSRRVLDKKLVELGPYGYGCQILQTPIPKGGGTFDVDKIMTLPSWGRFDRVWRFWDKAGTAKGGDYTVGVKMGMYLGKDLMGHVLRRYQILDVQRGQWNSNDREMRIINTAASDGKEVRISVEQEPSSSGKESAEGTQRRLANAGHSCELRAASGDKTQRADEYSIRVNAGVVSMVPAAWNAAYLEELKYFPNGKYDDQVDASSGCFNCLEKDPIIAGGLW